jgi:hypothetical protein
MSKICLIRQPAGIGDIFFTQKIAKDYISKGYTVIWPIIEQFEFIKDYIKIDGLTFVNENESFEYKNIYMEGYSTLIKLNENDVYLPIQHFDRHYPNQSVMYSKYNLLGIDYRDWADFFEFNRNEKKEEESIDLLGIRGKKYNFVNRNYGSPPHSQNCQHMSTYENSVEMEFIDGYNIFDWIGVILNAEHIYTAETSLLYLLTKLNLNNITVYSKHNPPNYFHVSELFPKNWNYTL